MCVLTFLYIYIYIYRERESFTYFYRILLRRPGRPRCLRLLRRLPRRAAACCGEESGISRALTQSDPKF